MSRLAADVPVVFVPGLGLGEESTRPTMRCLDRRCLVATLPGFGQRACRDTDVSPPALAERLMADQRLPRQPFVLVGHSSSCQIVTEATAIAPDRVTGLVLIGPTTDPTARTWGRLAIRWLATAVHERPRMVPSLIRQYARTGLLSILRSMEAARHHDIEAALDNTEVPLLVLRGKHDRIAPEPWVSHLAAVGGGQAATLPAGGHMIIWTHGESVADAMQRRMAVMRSA